MTIYLKLKRKSSYSDLKIQILLKKSKQKIMIFNNKIRDFGGETSPEVLKEAYYNGDWRVISEIAKNPNTPIEILERISEEYPKTYNPIIKNLVSNPKINDKIKINLSKTNDLMLILNLVKLKLPDVAYDNIINNYKGETSSHDAFIYAVSQMPYAVILKHTTRQDWKREICFKALELKEKEKGGLK